MSCFAGHAAAQQIAFTPSTLAFGNVVPGASKSQTVQVTNVTSSKISISGQNVSGTGYAVGKLTCPYILSPGQSTTFNVTFTPPAPGTDTGSVLLSSEVWNGNGNGNRKSKTSTVNSALSLSGSGIAAGQLTLSPSSYNFGNINTGTNATMTGVLSATGSAVTILSASSTNSEFLLTGVSFPVALAAGQSIPFAVTFGPQTSGSAAGSISFLSDAANSPTAESVTGTGVIQSQLIPSPSGFSFGNVQVGASKSLSGTLTNSGGTSVTISAASASGSGFSLNGLTLPLTLNAGQSTSFALVFNPTVTGVASGNLSVTSNGSNPNLAIPLSGIGVSSGMLGSNPASLSFGSVQAGSSSNNFETLTNTGGSTVTISQANVTGVGFSISGLTLPSSLAANQSVTFSVTYAPVSAGSGSGNIAFISDASNSTLNVALAGTGTSSGQLFLSPTALSFGNVGVGSNSVLNGSLSATGAPVTISSSNINSNEFVLSGISLPLTIAAGQSAPFTVIFRPNASGTASANLTFTNSSATSTIAQSLTGSGTASIQHSVDLSWLSSGNVIGYNVRRGSVSGGPYAILNSSLNSSTAYTDTTVTSGQTYYYVITAVDGASSESGYSNEVQTIIPAP